MRLWQRLLVTLVAMAAASLLVGLIWRALFGFELPSYLGGRGGRAHRRSGLGAPEADGSEGAAGDAPGLMRAR